MSNRFTVSRRPLWALGLGVCAVLGAAAAGLGWAQSPGAPAKGTRDATPAPRAAANVPRAAANVPQAAATAPRVATAPPAQRPTVAQAPPVTNTSSQAPRGARPANVPGALTPPSALGPSAPALPGGAARPGNPSPAETPSAESTPIVTADATRIVWINSVMVPAQTEGVITRIALEEGMLVEEGQTMAVLDDRQTQLMLQLKQAEEREAQLNAENDINLRDAQNSYQMAREKAAEANEMAAKGGVTGWEARQINLEAMREKLRIELAEMNREVAQVQHQAKIAERELAELELERRKIVAPFAGFVEARIAQLGEWLQPGAPVFQLVQMDRLRAQGFVPANDPLRVVAPGMPAVIEFALGGDRTERISGIVGFVGSDVDLQNRRKVWIEFENERVGTDWMFKPGMVPTIRIDTSQKPAAEVGQNVSTGSIHR